MPMRVRLYLGNLVNELCRLSASEQREFQQRMERKQMKEFMGVRCFPPEPAISVEKG